MNNRRLPIIIVGIIAFIVLMPVTYLLFITPYFVAGKQALLNNSPSWLDAISFVIVEIYGLYLFRQFRCSPTST